MLNLGYSKLSSKFLIKYIDDIQVNISFDDELVQGLTVYNNNNELIDISSDVLNMVKNDINSCL